MKDSSTLDAAIRTNTTTTKDTTTTKANGKANAEMLERKGKDLSITTKKGITYTIPAKYLIQNRSGSTTLCQFSNRKAATDYVRIEYGKTTLKKDAMAKAKAAFDLMRKEYLLILDCAKTRLANEMTVRSVAAKQYKRNADESSLRISGRIGTAFIIGFLK